MKSLTINSDQGLQTAIGELREQYRVRRFLTMVIRAGKGRSLDQNAMTHAWYEQVARELREDDARGVKRFCKLHFGVPILRAEDGLFRESYDRAIRITLSYEQKLEAMDILPVTSRMSTKQLNQYTDDVQAHYLKYGVRLEYPKEDA